jgi:uncharacterized membrane protein
MDTLVKLDLAKSEYIQLQGIIDAFDSRSFTVKAWSVTFSLAATGGAFASHSRSVLLVAAFSALLFWTIDGHWRTIQTAYYSRVEALERFFEDPEQAFVPMQIGSSWYKSFRSRQRLELVRAMVRPHVALPHAPILLVALPLYFAAVGGWVTV